MTYQEFKQALDTLGINGRASLAEIKSRHRALVKRHHPDTRQDPDGAATICKINDAYQIVNAYCTSYRFDFSEQEFLEQNPEERLRRQFATDPLWGRGGREAGD